MPSRKSQAILVAMKAAMPAVGTLDADLLRKAHDSLFFLLPPDRRTRIEELRLGGVPAAWIRPKGSDGRRRPAQVLRSLPPLKRLERNPPRQAILYFHGGAYMTGGLPYIRVIASRIAAAARVATLAIAYRLAPEHPYPAALEDALAAYDAMLAMGIPASGIVLAGESAGGNLVLSTALAIRDSGRPLPAGLACLSAWADLAGGSTYRSLADVDPSLDPDSLLLAARHFAGDIPLEDPRISPVHADLAGLPPTLIHAGSREIVLGDSLLLAERMQEAGVDATLEIYEGMWHVFQLFPVPEARKALQRIGRFIRDRLEIGP